MDGGAWWATVHRVAKSQIRLSNFTFIHIYMHVCIYMHTYTHMHTHICIYIYVYDVWGYFWIPYINGNI